MKILYFTKYTRKGASSRLRSYQYFTFLEKQDIQVTAYPLFNDRYLDLLYSSNSTFMQALKGYFERFFVFLSVLKYDKIIIEYELFPYFPAFFERFLFFIKKDYIVDYDDAIFHNYDKNKNPLVRFFLKNKIDVVMRNSYCVLAGNNYIAERAKKAGAKSIEILPTVIDLKRYEKGEEREKVDKIIVGWVGSPSTFKYVQQIKSVLKKIVDDFDVDIHIIGAVGDLGFTKNVKYIIWHEETEVAEIAKFDIGIMPLEDTPWEKGKCSYKLIQYMGCKKAVIASPVGMNNEVVRESVNGFLANSNEEWLQMFIKYINNPDILKTHGESGFKLVSTNYNIERCSKKLIAILNK